MISKFCKFSAFSFEIQTFSTITRTIFLTVGQNNFGSKIPFRTRKIFFHVQQSIKISPRFYIQVVSKADIVINNWVLVVPETFCLYAVESKKLRNALLISIQYNVMYHLQFKSSAVLKSIISRNTIYVHDKHNTPGLSGF